MKKFIRSLWYCRKWIKYAFHYERNLKIQVWLSTIAAIIAWFVGFTEKERIVYIFVVFLMFGMEIMNSAVEMLANEVTMKHKREIWVVKDLAAAASGLVSLGVGIVWLVFLLG